jgi:hypothetical protein
MTLMNHDKYIATMEALIQSLESKSSTLDDAMGADQLKTNLEYSEILLSDTRGILTELKGELENGCLTDMKEFSEFVRLHSRLQRSVTSASQALLSYRTARVQG